MSSYTPRNRSGNQAAAPIATSYAIVVLGALVTLVLLRRAFGSVHVEGGFK